MSIVTVIYVRCAAAAGCRVRAAGGGRGPTRYVALGAGGGRGPTRYVAFAAGGVRGPTRYGYLDYRGAPPRERAVASPVITTRALQV